MQIDKVIESEVPKDLSRIKHQLRDILVQNLNHSRDHREVEELANINKNKVIFFLTEGKPAQR